MPVRRYFIDHTIRAEQDDYETEGVEWEHVDYFNNKVLMPLLPDTLLSGGEKQYTNHTEKRQRPEETRKFQKDQRLVHFS